MGFGGRRLILQRFPRSNFLRKVKASRMSLIAQRSVPELLDFRSATTARTYGWFLKLATISGTSQTAGQTILGSGLPDGLLTVNGSLCCPHEAAQLGCGAGTKDRVVLSFFPLAQRRRTLRMSL